MSHAIDTEKVDGVLLADGWHKVHNNSFTVDSYEYRQNERAVFAGGQRDAIHSMGFSFTGDGGLHVCGPLVSVLAVRCRVGAAAKAV